MAPADEIPNVIWSNHIFVKLNIESLLCCKWVCKAWNGVICDPEFARIHFLHQNNTMNDKLLLTTLDSIDYKGSQNINGAAAAMRKPNINFHGEVVHCQILGSSNGLLCMSVRYKKRKYFPLEDLLIWNPTTGDSKFVTNICTDNPLSDSDPPLIGFLHEFNISDARILRISNFGFKVRDEPRVDIYSLKNNSWNNICTDFNPYPFNCVAERGGCIETSASTSIFYWLVDLNPRETENTCLHLLGFNLRENKFRFLKLPLDFQERCRLMYLKNVGGTVAIFGLMRIDNSPHSDTVSLVVWKMKEGDEWSKLLDINLSFFVSRRLFQPICFMKNGKVVLLFRKEWSGEFSRKLLELYDPITEEKEHRGICFASRWDVKAVAYVQSLVSPNNIFQGE